MQDITYGQSLLIEEVKTNELWFGLLITCGNIEYSKAGKKGEIGRETLLFFIFLNKKWHQRENEGECFPNSTFPSLQELQSSISGQKSIRYFVFSQYSTNKTQTELPE